MDTNHSTITFSVLLWVDSDSDGIPDWWLLQYFGHTTGSAADLSRTEDDADGDGVTNLAEYLAGTDPRSAGSYLAIRSITAGVDSPVELTWGSVSNKLYTVQKAASLTAGFTNLQQHILGMPPQNSYIDTSADAAGQYFYRLRLE